MSRETEPAVPPVVDTALTYRCVPRLGHRCWQYNPQATAIPTWALNWLNRQPDGRVEFCDRSGSTEVYFEPGDWLVEFLEDPDGSAYVFSGADFDEHYRRVLP